MFRMSRRGRRGTRGRRGENKLVFDRKLKIVEILSADVVGSSLPSSYDVFPFFFLSLLLSTSSFYSPKCSLHIDELQ